MMKIILLHKSNQQLETRKYFLSYILHVYAKLAKLLNSKFVNEISVMDIAGS